MKLKSKLILISLALSFFGLASSTLAATCGRVDSNGDYWYQCNGVKITQVAQTMLGDSITNFQSSASTASWTFYDGLNNITNNYSSIIPECIYNYPSYGTVVSFNTSGSMCAASYSMNWNSTVISSANPSGNCGYSQYQSYYNTFLNLVQQGFTLNGYNYYASTLDHTTTVSGYQSYYDVCRIPTSMTPYMASLSASSSTVNYNGSATLNWSSAGAISCYAPWTTSTATSGSEILSNLTSTNDYSIQCTNKGTPRWDHSSVLYNGKIYSWGGRGGEIYNFGVILNTLDIYDIATNSWSTGKTGGTARQLHTSALYNGKIYFWGGYGGAGVLNTVDIYDIATNSWSTGAAGGTARLNHSSILYEDKMYSLWGSNGSPLNTLDIYNITSNSWISTSNPETTVYASTTITVRIPQPPTASINSSAPVTNVGDKTLLTWSSTNANSCYAIGGWGKGIGTLPTSGSTTTSPVILGMNYFPISCSGSDGTAYATSTVEGKTYLLESNCPKNQEWTDEGSYYIAGHFVTPGSNECFCGDDTYSCYCGNDSINCIPDTYSCECGDAYCEYVADSMSCPCGDDPMSCECGDSGCVDDSYSCECGITCSEWDCGCGDDYEYCWEDSMSCSCGDGYTDCYEDCYDDGYDYYCDYYCYDIPDSENCACGDDGCEYVPETWGCTCGECYLDSMDCACGDDYCWYDSMSCSCGDSNSCECGDSQYICYDDTYSCACGNDYCEYFPDTYNCACGDSYSCLCAAGDNYWVDGMVEYVGYCQDINSNTPIVSLITQATNVYHGDKFTLTYSTDHFDNGDTCTLSGGYGWTGTVLTSPASQIEVGPISTTTTFGIVCSGNNGSASDYKKINLLDGGIYSDSDGSVVCEARQTNPEHKIYVNKNTTWNISIPTNIDLTGYTLSTDWSGDGISKINNLFTTDKIYTTVGLKRLNATTTATKSGSGTYRFTCSTSTNVILGNDIIQEI